jgi:hypothetical protein
VTKGEATANAKANGGTNTNDDLFGAETLQEQHQQTQTVYIAALPASLWKPMSWKM